MGRLAVIVDGHPDVFPVNSTIANRTLVFRTGSGTKQQAIEADAVVALEADAVSEGGVNLGPVGSDLTLRRLSFIFRTSRK